MSTPHSTATRPPPHPVPAARSRAGHTPRTQSEQRQGVGPDVALQVHDVEADDASESGKVERHDVRDVCRVAAEVVEVIGADMVLDPAVPVRPVDVDVAVHLPMVAVRPAGSTPRRRPPSVGPCPGLPLPPLYRRPVGCGHRKKAVGVRSLIGTSGGKAAAMTGASVDMRPECVTAPDDATAGSDDE